MSNAKVYESMDEFIAAFLKAVDAIPDELVQRCLSEDYQIRGPAYNEIQANHMSVLWKTETPNERILIADEGSFWGWTVMDWLIYTPKFKLYALKEQITHTIYNDSYDTDSYDD